ncbi:hypothetical protein [Enterobacter hormaechei]|uniref:hypothetical protein n=1 Tax=Enterobacter hormaechei TaxID=158836 RepID=UPI0023E36757|nr:hypothetical protein [Enterobacter hormaechei]MDF3686365.1 hypothetical protein [Enterobacter hormaechei]
MREIIAILDVVEIAQRRGAHLDDVSDDEAIAPNPNLEPKEDRSSKKKMEKGGDVIFKRPPPTFQDRLKELQEGAGITNFKALKYDTRIEAEKKQIEDRSHMNEFDN